jgi:ABC-type transport system substrate-binding protein
MTHISRIVSLACFALVVIAWTAAQDGANPAGEKAKKKGSGFVAGTALRVLRTTKPDPFFFAGERPVDRVTLTDGDILEIEPPSGDTLLDPQFSGTVSAQTVARGDEPARAVLLTRAGVAAYLPYERWVLDRVAQLDKEAASLPALERLQTAEKALAAALAFHLSARDRPLQGTTRWADLQADLERKLLETRLALLKSHLLTARDSAQWQKAVRFADSVADAYPQNTAALAEVGRLKTRYALFLVLQPASGRQTAGHYQETRRQLQWLDEHLRQPPAPDLLGLVGDTFLQSSAPVITLYNPEPGAIRAYLQHRAAALFAAAKSADGKQAGLLLKAAEEIWPTLPGLQDELLTRAGQYTILNVGVRSLPKYLSPARAVTDVERQTVELLFEGLVQLRPGPDGRLSYRPQLAAALPAAVGSERGVTLRQQAAWSDGSRVTTADVLKTLDLLSIRTPGRSAELTDLLELVRAGLDPINLAFTYRQGRLDPLAALTFKVLPREIAGVTLEQAGEEKFALLPVGSGPFMPAGTLTADGRKYLRFIANPSYATGPRHPAPQIREIRFFVSSDPAADFAHKTAPMHLLLDARTQDLSRLTKAGIRLAETATERRVYFLAINHRVPALADEKLRRALAHGIDRGRLLADHFGSSVPAFRAGSLAIWGAPGPAVAAAMAPTGAAHHQVLNGPYPAGSWAVCPDNRVPARLANLATAETFLRGVKAATVELELKYPDDDPRVEAACRALAGQLADLGRRVDKSIQLRLVGLPPHQLQRDVMARNYQLAYFHHDFATDLFSLWPLFDPREEAMETGSNYLGYKDDGSLVELLQRAASFRDFNQVVPLTHDIHVMLFEHMPLVPLWQLEYHIAVHPDLQLPLLDPRAVFGTIDEWRLEKK